MKNLDSITCIEDLKKLAKKRTPKMFFDYVESGSWTESTFRANCEDFALKTFSIQSIAKVFLKIMLF